MRVTLAVVAATFIGLTLTTLVAPASAQQQPVITLSPEFDAAGSAPATWTINVTGTGWGRARVFIGFAGTAVTSIVPTNGSFAVTISPERRGPGGYQVTATQDNCTPVAAPCPYTATATFRSLLVTLDPACRGAGAQTLVVTAQGFTPQSYGYVYFDLEGPEQQSRQRIPTGNGSFTATFDTTDSGREVAIDVSDLDGPYRSVTWSPCPPETTTSTTTTPVDTTTTSTTRPATGGSTSTTTTVTIPTITTIPPPTPGATLTVTPALGPAGFVPRARGTGFPANQPVDLGWSPGLGLFQATVGPDGTFETSVLVMHRDILGPRTLVATSGGVSATATYLVVQSTGQPSGKDVVQITRVRRFLNR